MSREADFDDFVAARSDALLRAAWLLTGDWHRAEDLLQTALAKSYLRWHRIADGSDEAYVRRVLVTTYATWWRRRWRGEQPTADLPVVQQASAAEDVELRQVLVEALGGLPRGQRAAVVLRHYCDLSEAEVAAALGCSTGTVKSQCAKGLARLRSSALADVLREGSPR
jgi:RNA polymerase sigma-70 factor (sigma-E family)